MLEIVREAADRIGGVSELARMLRVTRSAIYQWTEVPVDRAAELERLTGIPRSRLRPDMFPVVPALEAPSDYEHDYFAWLTHQASLLRGRRFADIDVDNLAEEIENLARAERREIESRLSMLLIHLLKWAHQPEHRTGSWAATIIEQRARILKRIQESPSLRSYPGDVLHEEYSLARSRAAAEMGLDLESLPSDCPYLIDQVLDPDFLP